ncbi:hypothetical protein NEOLI_000923 [Neolecta irregularis DAH-3]|uniref:Uncharacterized protein n=1 Tax=Neolecta irregularis (strain DAH-3) TaxID=1198029 RepID=A0A1U7LW03_NEOID|nr:hypothetical protein NEOLI_000923 [Neolecta irregularis DAH-3]|eukprot:OLL26847.1 hypothetical protein NEOLI_000923 [Neolecta irregularis DAH-3]
MHISQVAAADPRAPPTECIPPARRKTKNTTTKKLQELQELQELAPSSKRKARDHENPAQKLKTEHKDPVSESLEISPDDPIDNFFNILASQKAISIGKALELVRTQHPIIKRQKLRNHILDGTGVQIMSDNSLRFIRMQPGDSSQETD